MPRHCFPNGESLRMWYRINCERCKRYAMAEVNRELYWNKPCALENAVAKNYVTGEFDPALAKRVGFPEDGYIQRDCPERELVS